MLQIFRKIVNKLESVNIDLRDRCMRPNFTVKFFI